LTKPKPVSELQGLVYGLTPLPSEEHLPFYQKPLFWAAVVFVAFVALQIIFW
jgi:SSS family solute:Na+ symporter